MDYCELVEIFSSIFGHDIYIISVCPYTRQVAVLVMTKGYLNCGISIVPGRDDENIY